MKQVPQDLYNCCTTVAALISMLFQLAANDGVASRTGWYAVICCKLKQNANEGCNSCASLTGLVLSFIACFVLLVIALLHVDCRRSVRQSCSVLVSLVRKLPYLLQIHITATRTVVPASL